MPMAHQVVRGYTSDSSEFVQVIDNDSLFRVARVVIAPSVLVYPHILTGLLQFLGPLRLLIQSQRIWLLPNPLHFVNARMRTFL
jgi:hypothetical protein